MVSTINNTTPLATGFAPIADPSAKILILGSMPGVQSLQQQQYYAHPRNAFWAIMSELLAMDTSWDYQQRCAHILSHHLAIWDVLKTCQRQGSLDQNIEPSSMVSNDFTDFFQQHRKITTILFNGGKAEQLFNRYVLPTLTEPVNQIALIRLPSTSPAHASRTFADKLAIWQQALMAKM